MASHNVFTKVVEAGYPTDPKAKKVKHWLGCSPPPPRYLFSGCCTQKGHCPNVADPDHASILLTEVIGLGNNLKKFC
jgi:hypothetical protein